MSARNWVKFALVRVPLRRRAWSFFAQDGVTAMPLVSSAGGLPVRSREWAEERIVTSRPLQPEGLRDETPLNLRGPAPDPEDSRETVYALDRVFAHVADPAERLQDLVDHPSEHLARV